MCAHLVHKDLMQAFTTAFCWLSNKRNVLTSNIKLAKPFIDTLLLGAVSIKLKRRNTLQTAFFLDLVCSGARQLYPGEELRMSFTVCEPRRPTLFATIDGNNFFASYERVFNPSLNNKPVIVLSWILNNGMNFQSAGIHAMDLIKEGSASQKQLFLNQPQLQLFRSNTSPQSIKLNKAIDAVNQRHGKDTVFWTSSGISPRHIVKQSQRSPL